MFEVIVYVEIYWHKQILILSLVKFTLSILLLSQQLADIFTKPLCEATFTRLVNELGMVSGSFSKSA